MCSIYQYRTILCSCGWLIGAILVCSSFLVNSRKKHLFQFTYYTYVYPALDVILVTESVLVYSYIFYQLRKKRNVIRALESIHGNAKGRKKPQFLVPFSIIASFTLFFVIPDLVIATNGIETIRKIDFIYQFNAIADALIYIFLQPPIRRRLFRLIRRHSLRQQHMITIEISTSVALPASTLYK